MPPRPPVQDRPRLARLAAPSMLLAALATLLAALAAAPASAWREGPPPDRVGACGFGGTCREAGCHSSFPVGSTTLSWQLSVALPTPAPLPSLYRPGELYELVLEVEDTDPMSVVFGFELAPIADCPFQERGGDVVPTDPDRVRRFEGGDHDLVFLSHDCSCPAETPDCCGYVPPAGPGTGANAWRFAWMAPERGTGEVSFALAINAANWDTTPEGDRIVLGEVFVDEEPCPPRIEDLTVTRADCDGSGEPRVALAWTDAGGATVLRSADPGDLAAPKPTWPAEPADCLPLDPRPLVFYSAAEACQLGSEGVH